MTAKIKIKPKTSAILQRLYFIIITAFRSWKKICHQKLRKILPTLCNDRGVQPKNSPTSNYNRRFHIKVNTFFVLFSVF